MRIRTRTYASGLILAALMVSQVGCRHLKLTQASKAAKDATATNDVVRQLSLARLHERQGNTEAAEKIYLTVLADDPQQTLAHHRLGVLAGRAGKLESAVQHLENARKHGDDSAELISDLAYARYLQGDAEQAEALLQLALKTDPSNKTAQVNRGIVLAALDKDEAALAAFQQAGSMADAWNNLAFMQSQRGDLTEARNSWLKALDYDPNLKTAAEALVAMKSHDGAMNRLARRNQDQTVPQTAVAQPQRVGPQVIMPVASATPIPKPTVNLPVASVLQASTPPVALQPVPESSPLPQTATQPLPMAATPTPATARQMSSTQRQPMVAPPSDTTLRPHPDSEFPVLPAQPVVSAPVLKEVFNAPPVSVAQNEVPTISDSEFVLPEIVDAIVPVSSTVVTPATSHSGPAANQGTSLTSPPVQPELLPTQMPEMLSPVNEVAVAVPAQPQTTQRTPLTPMTSSAPPVSLSSVVPPAHTVTKPVQTPVAQPNGSPVFTLEDILAGRHNVPANAIGSKPVLKKKTAIESLID